VDGEVQQREMGTPQGGPLSLILANVLLDKVDKELERRGHCFVRYADDANVYVRSQRAGKRVMALLLKLYGRLRLTVHPTKSTVASVFQRKFLGYSFWVAPGGTGVADKAKRTFKQRVRELTRRSGGVSLSAVVEKLRTYALGWKAYFRLAQTPKVWRELDKWLRHRMRAIQLRQWKRGTTAYRELIARGTSKETAQLVARHTRRWWRNSGMLLNGVLDLTWADKLGVPRLS
jgi:RNA-directed DNA polymerase